MASLTVHAGSPAPPATATPFRAASTFRRALIALAFAAASGAMAQETAGAGSGGRPAAAPPTAAGDARRGAALFSGRIRLANGGPPCGACHDAAGLPFPGGGTMGPDLTDSYSKYGPEPLDLVLTTLFFPTMDPIFAKRPLTPPERGDLLAFLAEASARSPPRGATLRTLLLGAAVFLFLAAVVGVFGRTRLRGVRAPLVRAAIRRQREARR